MLLRPPLLCLRMPLLVLAGAGAVGRPLMPCLSSVVRLGVGVAAFASASSLML